MKKVILVFVFSLFSLAAIPQKNSLAKFNKSLNGNNLSNLEAVLVVGNTEESTKSAIEEMNSLALVFIKNGIKVTKFYDKNTNWESIKVAAKTASFFVYDGHGSTLGINGATGGLCLNKFISTEQILADLRLKKNALVLFKSVCGGAGSSASDTKDIGIDEAAQRVTDYSYPFFSIGASCYYANNFTGGVDLFLTEFLDGKNIEECFNTSTKYPDYKKSFKFDNKKQIYVSSNESSGMITQTTYVNGIKKVKKIHSYKQYNIALVGNPNYTIKDLTSELN